MQYWLFVKYQSRHSFSGSVKNVTSSYYSKYQYYYLQKNPDVASREVSKVAKISGLSLTSISIYFLSCWVATKPPGQRGNLF